MVAQYYEGIPFVSKVTAVYMSKNGYFFKIMTTDRQIWLGFMRVPGGIMDCDISLERYFQDLFRELILIKI